MTCYASSPEFLARVKQNLSQPKSRNGPKRTLNDIPCAHCGKLMHVKPYELKRGKKTCSQQCYRAYFAQRFDRHIADKRSLTEVNNFDEFLSQEIMSCLKEGCSWKGHSLAAHMNQAHGLDATTVKMTAGFNLGSALVSTSLKRKLDARGNCGNPVDHEKAQAARRFDYISRESKEHQRKTRLLKISNK